MFLVSIWSKIYKISYIKKAISENIKMLINDGKQITMCNEINLTLKSFYENLFKKDIKKYVSDIETF